MEFQFYEGKALSKSYNNYRILNTYPSLFPLNKSDDNLGYNIKIMDELRKQGVTKESNILFLSNTDLRKITYLSTLWYFHKLLPFEQMSTFELMEIYFGKMPDMYETIMDITVPYLGLNVGFPEPANKMKSDILYQFLEIRNKFRRPVWMFYKGTLANMGRVDKTTHDCIKSIGYKVIDLDLLFGLTEKQKDCNQDSVNRRSLENDPAVTTKLRKPTQEAPMKKKPEVEPSIPTKRGRGRPKGSRNKKTQGNAQAMDLQEDIEKYSKPEARSKRDDQPNRGSKKGRGKKGAQDLIDTFIDKSMLG